MLFKTKQTKAAKLQHHIPTELVAGFVRIHQAEHQRHVGWASDNKKAKISSQASEQQVQAQVANTLGQTTLYPGRTIEKDELGIDDV